MKNFLKLIFTIILFINIQCKAQTLDTLNYLKQFEANKANYIGQPLSKLLNDMTQIQPKTVWSIPSKNKRSNVQSTQFKFCNMNKSFHNAVTLHIIWQDAILTSQTKYYEQLNGFYFSNDEKTFYGSKIIKDILVYR